MHEVKPATPSAIPLGRVVIVIDVGDSALAPHQATPTKTYYYREGGHSKPAPHFYLETLRNRLARPSLEAELTQIELTHAVECDGGLFIEMVLHFLVTNEGRVAAYKWALTIDGVSGWADGRWDGYKFARSKFPMRRGGPSSIRIDDTILPSLALSERKDLGLQLRPASPSREHLIEELHAMIPTEFELKFRVVSETSLGELRSKKLADLIDYGDFARTVESLLCDGGLKSS